MVRARLQEGGSVIILVDNLNKEEEVRLLYLGIRGIIPMITLEKDLVAAADSIIAGSLWFRRDALDRHVMRTMSRGLNVSKFTIREEQIIALMQKEFSNKEIGRALDISERTVKFHVSNILQKLNIKSRKGVCKATRMGPETLAFPHPTVA